MNWLPATLDVKAGLKALVEVPDASPDRWPTLRALAQTRLGALEVSKLDKHLRRLCPTRPSGLPMRAVRLAVLASSNVDHLLGAIRVGALRHGIWVEVYTPDYGQYLQELLDASSGLHRFAPDTVLFALDPWHVVGDQGTRDESPEMRVDAVLARLERVWNLAAQAFACQVIQQDVLPLFPAVFGNNEHRLPGSPKAIVDRLRGQLRERSEAYNVDVLAICDQVEQDGLKAWHDLALWHRAKQEIHPLAAPLYGDLLGRLLAARQGGSAKCLVLDLDNTLWGGVIGDDGLDGIRLGQGSAEGEAFLEMQRFAKMLSQRGIILAVCSKNDYDNALEAFDHHPDMLLRRSDIACFAVNWVDKAENLRVIAKQLNIGLDALVFVDDNPYERNIVRRELPMVRVPELPDDPALYVECLSRAGYFEGVRLTADDLGRTAQYQSNLQRDLARSSTTDVGAYLASLDMQLQCGPVDPVTLPRVVQLINKTNQFNLTTRRHDTATVSAWSQDPSCLCLQARLVDTFGDNGIISVVMARPAEDGRTLLIDTWLMSCRVLGRQVEEAMLNVLVEHARRLGHVRLTGEFVPTAKNSMVQSHYAKLGFTAQAAQGETSASLWDLDISLFEPRLIHIRIPAP